MSLASNSETEAWPPLPFQEWKETCATLHMWTQIVGKVRLALTPWTNHSWHVTLYLTARGLTTSPIPFGARVFQIDFDFVDHLLRIQTGGTCFRTSPDSGGSDAANESRTCGSTSLRATEKVLLLAPKSVSQFYGEVMTSLRELDLPVEINTTPNEVDPAIPFEKNEENSAYDPEYANRFWRVLLQSDRVFKEFRAGFCGKCSPVHFFWGSFDLAVTRFSGRRAPPHPGGVPHLPDAVAREAYSHEVSSLGFWPGNATMPEPIFYSYAYPQPEAFPEAKVEPAAAAYNSQLKEFVLPYEAVRLAPSPDQALLAFARSTYDAASTLGNWDRAALVEIKPDLHSPRQHP
ncbi:MAG TPA: DUF5996 family protein [Chthoniobacterales bacterium]|nr:DUF5996 family protein [Chthoniobacterales bacterium]